MSEQIGALGSKPMRTFIFLCDMTTEAECLERMLFGTNPGESLRLHYSTIAVGDRLFLYNFELGTLWGPFTALTTCIHNLDPRAFRKGRRAFPWQVRVDGGGSVKNAIRIDAVARFIPLSQTKVGLLPPAELADEQASQLLAAMEAGQ